MKLQPELSIIRDRRYTHFLNIAPMNR